MQKYRRAHVFTRVRVFVCRAWGTEMQTKIELKTRLIPFEFVQY